MTESPNRAHGASVVVSEGNEDSLNANNDRQSNVSGGGVLKVSLSTQKKKKP